MNLKNDKEGEMYSRVINEVILHLKNLHPENANEHLTDTWLTVEEAMRMLSIKSKTTLLKLKNLGLLVFSQPTPKKILFSKQSILKYLESKSHKTF